MGKYFEASGFRFPELAEFWTVAVGEQFIGGGKLFTKTNEVYGIKVRTGEFIKFNPATKVIPFKSCGLIQRVVKYRHQTKKGNKTKMRNQIIWTIETTLITMAIVFATYAIVKLAVSIF